MVVIFSLPHLSDKSSIGVGGSDILSPVELPVLGEILLGIQVWISPVVVGHPAPVGLGGGHPVKGLLVQTTPNRAWGSGARGTFLTLFFNIFKELVFT